MPALSPRFVQNLAHDVLHLRLPRHKALRPLFASFFVSWRCNLDCTYCRFPVYRGRLPERAPGVPRDQCRPDLDTRAALRVLRILAQGVGSVGFSGGEPLLRQDLPTLTAEAQTLGLNPVILTTNGLLLPRRPEVLESVDVVQISVDDLCDDRLLDAVRWAGAAQGRFGFKLVLNAVLGGQPTRAVAGVEALARSVGASFTVVRQVGSGGTVVRPQQEAQIRELYAGLRLRRLLGDRVLGSSPGALNHYETREDFGCLPELNLRVLPDGTVPLPCYELPRASLDLTAVDGWRDVARALDRYRLDRPCPTPCFAPCHLEPTLMVRRPWNALWVAQTGTARAAPDRPPPHDAAVPCGARSDERRPIPALAPFLQRELREVGDGHPDNERWTDDEDGNRVDDPIPAHRPAVDHGLRRRWCLQHIGLDVRVRKGDGLQKTTNYVTCALSETSLHGVCRFLESVLVL